MLQDRLKDDGEDREGHWFREKFQGNREYSQDDEGCCVEHG